MVNQGIKTFIGAALCAIWMLSCASNPVGRELESAKYCGNLMHEGKEVRWNTLPIVLVVSPDTPDVYKNAVHIAATMWNLAVNYNVFMVYTEIKTEYVSDMPNVVEVIYFKDSWEGRKDKYANAKMWFSIYGIKDAEVSINNLMMGTLSEKQIAAVMFHELGHVLGIDHSEDTSSIMYPSFSLDLSQSPDGAINTFNCMYRN